MLDLQMLDKGQTYRMLNRSFIIFICLEDIFGKGRHIYTFENLCKEDHGISMGDGTTKIFLNADSRMDDVGAGLRAFLDYAAGRVSDDIFVQELDEAVREAKKNREWRREYMTLLMRDQLNIEKGIEKGEGRLSQLIARLMADQRTQDVIRVTQDGDYRNKLYEEYFIK